MKKRKLGLISKLAITGAAIGGIYTVAANILVENLLGKKSIKSLISRAALNPTPETDCFYNSEEALKGIEFYKKHRYEKLFIFNKHAECLHSIFYKNEGSHIYAISCHGFTGDPSQNNIYARRFYEMGYNVLLPYLRGHGKSEHYYCTMGWLDRLDILDWIHFITEKDSEAKIILHGASMGAATVMNATGENLPDNVICCIEDCGFSSLREQYGIMLQTQTKIPPEFLIAVANPIMRSKLGFDINEASPLVQVGKSKTPTLFIHGDNDNTVPVRMLYSLYQNAACPKEKLIVEGATHAASGYVFPEIYWDSITAFINKYI